MLMPLAKDVDARVMDELTMRPSSKAFSRVCRSDHGLGVIFAMTAYLWLTEITRGWCGDEVTMVSGDEILSAGTPPICSWH